MEIVRWLDRDEVEKILMHEPNGERIVYSGISERAIREVLDVMEQQEIKFYQEWRQ